MSPSATVWLLAFEQQWSSMAQRNKTLYLRQHRQHLLDKFIVGFGLFVGKLWAKMSIFHYFLTEEWKKWTEECECTTVGQDTWLCSLNVEPLTSCPVGILSERPLSCGFGRQRGGQSPAGWRHRTGFHDDPFKKKKKNTFNLLILNRITCMTHRPHWLNFPSHFNMSLIKLTSSQKLVDCQRWGLPWVSWALQPAPGCGWPCLASAAMWKGWGSAVCLLASPAVCTHTHTQTCKKNCNFKSFKEQKRTKCSVSTTVE